MGFEIADGPAATVVIDQDRQILAGRPVDTDRYLQATGVDDLIRDMIHSFRLAAEYNWRLPIAGAGFFDGDFIGRRTTRLFDQPNDGLTLGIQSFHQTVLSD